MHSEINILEKLYFKMLNSEMSTVECICHRDLADVLLGFVRISEDDELTCFFKTISIFDHLEGLHGWDFGGDSYKIPYR